MHYMRLIRRALFFAVFRDFFADRSSWSLHFLFLAKNFRRLFFGPSVAFHRLYGAAGDLDGSKVL